MLQRGKRCDYYTMKERRTRLKITYDILHAISNETDSHQQIVKGQPTIALTRIQTTAHMAYDKIKQTVINLEKHGLLTLQPLKVTDRGFLFMHEYESIMKSTDRLQNNVINNTKDNDTKENNTVIITSFSSLQHCSVCYQFDVSQIVLV